MLGTFFRKFYLVGSISRMRRDEYRQRRPLPLMTIPAPSEPDQEARSFFAFAIWYLPAQSYSVIPRYWRIIHIASPLLAFTGYTPCVFCFVHISLPYRYVILAYSTRPDIGPRHHFLDYTTWILIDTSNGMRVSMGYIDASM